jgi:hypothetical protein
MSPNLNFARSGVLHRTRFVLVNDRIPCTDGSPGSLNTVRMFCQRFKEVA